MIRVGYMSPIMTFRSSQTARTDETPGIFRNSADSILKLNTLTAMVKNPDYKVIDLKSGSKGLQEDEYVRLEQEGASSKTLSVKSGISYDDKGAVSCIVTLTDNSNPSKVTGIEYFGPNKTVNEEAQKLIKAVQEKKQVPEPIQQNCLLPF